MRAQLSLTSFLSVLFLVTTAGCSGDGDGDGGEPSEVNLPDYVESAGLADIQHGTAKYEPPQKVDRDIEERIFVAFLSGGQEVPPIKTEAQGAMVLLLSRDGTKVNFFLSHNVQDATVAHLHNAAAGENGAIAVALPNARSNQSGTLPLNADQVKALKAGQLYANVHSMKNAMGEVRGQILRPGETLFVAPLVGSEEVPPVASMFNGVASVILNADRTEIKFRITAKGITPTALHIHRGIVGVNGPIVYALPNIKDMDPVGLAVTHIIEGTQAVVASDLRDLQRRQWYVNMHSSDFPMGELRGQLLRPGEVAFGAKLTPDQEVPPVMNTNTGNGMVVLGMALTGFLYVVTTDVVPTVAHIHKAPGGVNGPIEVALEPVSQNMFGIEDLGPARAADVIAGRWYFNVHNAQFPMGAIRGQVLRPGETLYTAVLSGASEVPPISTTASGGAGVILNAAQTEIRYSSALMGITPTVAHIHQAPAGMNGAILYALTLMGGVPVGTQAVTPADVMQLNNAGLYVNIHSAANPMGEIRGQLIKR